VNGRCDTSILKDRPEDSDCPCDHLHVNTCAFALHSFKVSGCSTSQCRHFVCCRHRSEVSIQRLAATCPCRGACHPASSTALQASCYRSSAARSACTRGAHVQPHERQQQAGWQDVISPPSTPPARSIPRISPPATPSWPTAASTI
jgi:hypothetical protein